MRFGTYAPKNFDEGYHGTVTIREALAQSLNIPAVKVLAAVGPGKLAGRFRRVGVEPAVPRQDAADAGHGARRRRPDAARPRHALRQPGARRRGRRAHAPARRCSRARRSCCFTGKASRCRRPRRPVAARRLVRHRHPQGRAAAAQRQGRPLRLQDRHLLRLPRRLGHRLRRPLHRRRVGRPPRWRLHARASSAASPRRPSCSMPSPASARSARRSPAPPRGVVRATGTGAAAAAEALPRGRRRDGAGPVPRAARAHRVPARSRRGRDRGQTRPCCSRPTAACCR